MTYFYDVYVCAYDVVLLQICLVLHTVLISVTFAAATFDASTCVLSTENQQGVLPSAFTGETLCGTQIMPWVISVHEYQTITVELMDFSATTSRSESDGQQYQTQTCYATISEPGLARQTSACACGERSCHVTTSRSHTINIVMRPTGRHNFILLYRGNVLDDDDHGDDNNI